MLHSSSPSPVDSSPPSSEVRRLRQTLLHLQPSLRPSGSDGRSVDLSSSQLVPVACDFHRESDRDAQSKDQGGVKWNGWGYSDTKFKLNEDGLVYLTGDRYEYCNMILPKLREWAENEAGVSVHDTDEAQLELDPSSFSPPIVHEKFLQQIKSECEDMTIEFDNYARLHHGHGHTCNEIYKLRHEKFGRIPDCVVWPRSHDDVVKIVRAANKWNVCIIPFGGGTTVTEAVECPHDETRMIVSMDMKRMDQIKWIDGESMTACIQAGAVGIKLDKKLRSMGYILGHEPDSFEFSTLGGWLATRASGMKKNTYGNIDDIVVNITMVTPQGIVTKGSLGPRQSVGPELLHWMMGSEGMFGVITEAVMRVRHVPECEDFGSIAFPTFEDGVEMMHEVARQRCAPASIRLVDNVQFRFGQALKPETHSRFTELVDQLKKLYVTRVKGFDPDRMVAATLVFIGTAEEVKQQKKRIYAIARRFRGLPAGSENGRRGYFLTYMIAYVRDFIMDFHYIAESFETAVPWANVSKLIRRVKARLHKSCEQRGITPDPFVSARVTQTYETGACVYFYFGFLYSSLDDPKRAFEEVEREARDEVIACGGSLSHHHGVGKIRKRWMVDANSAVGVDMLRSVKSRLDPKNIFCARNMFDPVEDPINRKRTMMDH